MPYAPPSIGEPTTSSTGRDVTRVQTSVDTPDFVRPEVALYQRARRRGRHLLEGSDAIHDAGTEYLPQWPDEENDTYAIRSTLTEVYGAYQRCVSAARGLVGAKPPTLADGASARMQAVWEDVDGEGTHGEIFAMRRFEDGLVDGITAILVDHPSELSDQPGATLEDYQKAGLRPYWVPILYDQFANWRYEKVYGKTMLTMVTIHEEVDDLVGTYGVVCADQYRTIRLVQTAADANGVSGKQILWEIKRKKVVRNKEVWVITSQGEYRGVDRIPLAIGYFGRKIAPLVADTPLGAIAELNIGHYRVSSDRRYLMSIVHAPTLAFEGWVDPQNTAGNPNSASRAPGGLEIGVGPNSVIKTPPDCTVKWLQADPNGLQSSKEEKDDLVAQMASMSIAFLQQERKSQETATAHRINSTAQNATLATAGRGEQDMLDDANDLTAQYLDEPAVKSVVNTTYDEDALDAPTIVALSGLAKDGNMTRRTLLQILQRGNIVPDTVDIDEENDALDAQQREQQDALARNAALAQAKLSLLGTDDPSADPTEPSGGAADAQAKASAKVKAKKAKQPAPKKKAPARSTRGPRQKAVA